MKIDEKLKAEIIDQVNPSGLLREGLDLSCVLLGVDPDASERILKNIEDNYDIEQILYESLVQSFKRKDRLRKWLELEEAAREGADNFAQMLDTILGKELDEYLPEDMKIGKRSH